MGDGAGAEDDTRRDGHGDGGLLARMAGCRARSGDGRRR
jgi:hypothetical protein